MTRLQSIVGVVTLAVCLGVGLWACQRPLSSKAHTSVRLKSVSVGETPDGLPTGEHSEPDLVLAMATEPAVSPRKLTADDAAPATDHPVRRAIDRLMPHANAEERQIWFEELRNLPVNAVEDLLRLRKESNVTTPLQSPTTAFDPIECEVIGNHTIRMLVHERWLLLHNLLNAETPGYRALRSQRTPLPFEVVEASWDGFPDAVHWHARRLDLRPGELEITDRALDVAIVGEGWFVVENQQASAGYTRNGALQLNDARELALPSSDGIRPLLPKITIPESTAQIFIDANGKIYGASEAGSFDTEQPLGQILLARFFDDSALELKKDGLYYPTKAAGAMERRVPGEQIGTLRAGSLERSNVNRSEQEQSLERVEQWLKRMSSTAVAPASEPRQP